MTTPRIFIVEDEALIAMELEDRLQQLGYDVCGRAAKSAKALEQIPEARPDLVLMDVHLGSGPSGLDVAEKLRERFAEPIIFLTAYSDTEVVDRASRIASSTFLLKPFTPQVLHANIRMALATHAVEQQLREANRKIDETAAALRRQAMELEEGAARLRESEARFRALFEQAAVGVSEVDSSTGRFLRANHKFCEILGYSAEEMLALDFRSVARPEYREEEVASMARLKRGDVREFTMQALCYRKDGGPVWVNLTVSPLWKPGEAPTHHIAVVEDITERIEAEESHRQLEEQLRHSQKMEAIGTLSGGIAHDFNNLLTVIVGNLELARHELPAPHPVAPYLEAMSTATDRAKDLVHQILAFSRKQPPRRVPTELGPVVVEAAKLLRSTIPTGVELDVEVGSDIPCVLADESQMQQVVMNLGTNAWHALAGASGRVSIRAGGVDLDRDAAASLDLRPGRYAQVEVSDSGQGMDEKTLERIFEPFFTTKGPGKGSGLGLSVVHGIVREHAGAIRVASRPGFGSTFSVYLPETSSEPMELPEPRALTSEHRGKRILYLDDEAEVVAVATSLLEQLGCTVSGFVRASEAIEAIGRTPSGFDMIFTDYNMPGMSGLEFARQVHRICPSTPLVLVSGFEEQTDQALEASGIRYRLRKPFALKNLSEMLRHVRGAEGRAIWP